MAVIVLLLGTFQIQTYLMNVNVCFINQSSPVMTISKNGIRFSKACHTRLEGCEYVELLYHPILQVVILRKSNRDDSTAIHWENKDKICSSFSGMKKKQIKFFPDVYKDRIGKSYNDYIAGHQMNLFEDFIGYQGSAVLDEPEQKTDTISVPIPQCEESENIPLPDLSEQPENGQPEKSLISCRFARLDLFTLTCFCLSWCVTVSVFSGVNGFWLRSIELSIQPVIVFVLILTHTLPFLSAADPTQKIVLVHDS